MAAMAGAVRGAAATGAAVLEQLAGEGRNGTPGAKKRFLYGSTPY